MISNNKTIFRTIAANFMRPSLPGGIAGVLVHLAILFLAYQLYLTKASQNELNLINQGNKVKYELEKVFNESILSLAEASLSVDVKGNISDFEKIAAEILKENKHLENIAVLPGGKFKSVYPQNELSKQLLGTDLLKDGDRKLVKRIYDGIYSQKMGFAGPFPDTRYDSVLIGYDPIFLDGRFWGLYLAKMPLKNVFKIIDTINTPGLNFSISNFDPLTQKRVLVYAKDNIATDEKNKSSYSEKILHNNWHLHVSAQKTSWLNILLMPYVISLLIAVLVGSYINGMVNAKRRLGGAESALKLSNLKFRSMFENAPIGIAQIDFHTRKLIEANKKFCELTGFKDTELIGKGLNEIVPPEYYNESRKEFDESIGQKNGQLQRLYKHQNKNGRVAYVNFTVKPVVEPDGAINMNVLVVEDITEAEVAKQALSASEKHYKSLFEDSPIALWEQDFSFLKAYFTEKRLINKTYEEIYNYFVETPNAFEECFNLFKVRAFNKSTVELYDATDKTDLLNNIKFLLSSPASMEYTILALTALSNGLLNSKYETSIFTLSGRIKEIEYRWNVAPGYEKDYGRVIVAMSDITQLKQAETKAREAARALHISQQRFEALFDNSPTALWEEDFSGVKNYLIENNLWRKTPELITEYFRNNPDALTDCKSRLEIISANKAALKSYGVDTFEEAATVLSQALNQPESNEAFVMQLAALANGSLRLREEARSVNEKGETIYLDLSWNVLPGHEETLERVLVATSDITQIKRSETEIEAARARLETIINTIDGIVWTADPETASYSFVSDNAFNIMGYPKKAWTNKPDFCARYMHKDDAALVLPQCKRDVDAGIPHSSEYRMITKDGKTKWFRESINYTKQNGVITSLIGIIIDITDLKNAKDNLQQSLDIVSKQNKQLMQFSYIVSHNLRSHIANISSLCELISDSHTTPEEQKAYVGHLSNISDILNDTMAGLNEVTHIQTSANLTIKPLNLKEFIDKTLTILSNVIVAQDAEIVTRVNNEVFIDYYQPYLESVLLCFISNALKYSSPERKPLLKIDYNEQENVLVFEDNGIGIDLEQHGDKIFGLFKKFTSNPDSRGIGLYIAKNQIEAMGGHVTVCSTVNVGTTFKIFFNG